MNHARDRAEINGAVEKLPAPPSEAADPSCRRSYRQRDQKHEPSEAYGDVRSFCHILKHIRPTQAPIYSRPCGEMQAGIEKCEESQHTAEANQLRQTQNL